MIDLLPDGDSIRFFIDMMGQFNMITKKIGWVSNPKDTLSEKQQAFLHMEEMKKKYPFPKDYDYEQVRREAMKKKYGCVN